MSSWAGRLESANAARQRQDEGEQRAAAAMERLREGDTGGARRLLRRVVDEAGGGAANRAAAMLATLELAEGDPEQADELLEYVAAGPDLADGFVAALQRHLMAEGEPYHPVLGCLIDHLRLGAETGVARYEEAARHPDPAVSALAKVMLAHAHLLRGEPHSRTAALLGEAAAAGDPRALSYAALLSWLVRPAAEAAEIIALLRRARAGGEPALAPWIALAAGAALAHRDPDEARSAYETAARHPGLAPAAAEGIDAIAAAGAAADERRRALAAAEPGTGEHAELLGAAVGALVDAGRVAEARELRARAVESVSGDGVHADVLIGWDLYDKGRLDLAAELFGTAIANGAEEGDDAESVGRACALLGRIRAAQGDTAEAARLARRAAALFERRQETHEDAGAAEAAGELLAQAMFDLGDHLAAAGDEDGAREAYERAAQGPGLMELRVRERLGTAGPADRAVIRLHDGDRAGALELLTEDYGEPLLAELHVALFEDDLAAVRTLVRAGAGSGRAGELLAEAAVERLRVDGDDRNGARDLYELALESAPPEPVTWMCGTFGFHYGQAGDLETAIEVLERGAAAEHPAALDCLRDLVVLLESYSGERDHPALEPAARRAVASGDSETVGVGAWALADLCARRDDLAAARDHYRLALEHAHPESEPRIRALYGATLERLGETEAAYREMEAVLVSEDIGMVMLAGLQLGTWLANGGDLARAAEAFGTAAAAGQANPDPSETEDDHHQQALNNLGAVAEDAAAAGDPALAVRALHLAAVGGAPGDAARLAQEYAAAAEENGDPAAARVYREGAAAVPPPGGQAPQTAAPAGTPDGTLGGLPVVKAVEPPAAATESTEGGDLERDLEQDLEPDFERAFELEADGDLAGAIAAFGRVATTGTGDDAEISANNAVALAVRAAEAGEHEAAMHGFAKGAEAGLYSDVVFLAWEAALRATAAGDIPAAHAYYGTALGLDAGPDGPDADLIRELEDARAILPEPRPELEGLYEALRGDDPAAVRPALEALKGTAHAGAAAATVIAVSRARRSGDRDGARALLPSVTELAPPEQAAVAWDDLGDLTDDPAAAVEAYRNGAAIDHPAAYPALRSLCWALYRGDDLDAAVEAAGRALATGDPETVAHGHRVLGRVRMEREDPEGAVRAYRQGLEAAGTGGTAMRIRLDLSLALHELGEDEAAAAEARRVRDESGDEEQAAKAESYLGNIAYQGGDKPAALEAFGRVAVLEAAEGTRLSDIVDTARNNVMAIAIEAGKAGDRATAVRGMVLAARAGVGDGPVDAARRVAFMVGDTDGDAADAFLATLVGVDPEHDHVIREALDGAAPQGLSPELQAILDEHEGEEGSLAEPLLQLMRDHAGTHDAAETGRRIIRTARMTASYDSEQAIGILRAVAEHGDPAEAATAYDDIGDLYGELDDPAAAIEAYRKGSEIDDPAALVPLRSLLVALLEAADHDGVAEHAQRAVTSGDPQTVAAGYWMWGDSRHMRGDTDGARRLYRQGIGAAGPELAARIRLDLARTLRDREENADARAELDLAAAAGEPDVRARAGTLLGQWAFEDGDLAAAAEALGQVAAMGSDGDGDGEDDALAELVESAAGNLVVVANNAYAEGRHEVAVRALTLAARAGDPELPLRVAHRRATELTEDGDRAAAMLYVEGTVRFAPGEPDPERELELAALFAEADQPAKAREICERLAGHPDGKARLRALSTLVQLLGRYGDDAELAAATHRLNEAAAGLGVDEPRLASMFGMMQADRGDPRVGLRVLRTAAGSGEPGAVWALGDALVNAGEHAGAREVLAPLSGAESRFGRLARVTLGRSYHDDDPARARELYLAAIDAPGEENPVAVELARMYLGSLAKRERDWPEALRWYQAVIDTEDGQQRAMAAAHLGELAYWLDDRDGAVRFYERCLDIGTGDAELLGESAYRLGELRYGAGEVDRARGHLRDALASGHEGFAEQARVLLAKLDG
ncbi:tetratricopeptide repeat protein [Spirillospora sp. NPDC029432]|uniref:tetratricopeptide repeat protein n=1 Tax=Spirillospora sp. NPDC029432 TaxID=3154599 RepID=UPI0034527FEB